MVTTVQPWPRSRIAARYNLADAHDCEQSPPRRDSFFMNHLRSSRCASHVPPQTRMHP
jgi:hypothetical protein